MKPLSPGSHSRRASLATLFTTGIVGVLAHAQVGDAKQSIARKAKKRCRQQQSQCVTLFLPAFGGEPACTALVDQCCEFTARCDFTGFFACSQQIA